MYICKYTIVYTFVNTVFTFVPTSVIIVVYTFVHTLCIYICLYVCTFVNTLFCMYKCKGWCFRMQSKVKNFRFTEVMCSDLDRLATVWKCTATEAVARALTQAVTVEDWKAYQSAQHGAQHENFSLDEEKSSPEEQQQPEPDRAEDSGQTVTTIVADAAPRAKKPKVAEQLPLPMDKPKRLQVRIFARGEKKPYKTFSSYDRSELDRAANQWLTEHGYPTYSESNGTSFRWNV